MARFKRGGKGMDPNMSADIIFIEGGVICALRCTNWNFELKFMATLVRRLSVLNKIIGQ